MPALRWTVALAVSVAVLFTSFSIFIFTTQFVSTGGVSSNGSSSKCIFAREVELAMSIQQSSSLQDIVALQSHVSELNSAAACAHLEILEGTSQSKLVRAESEFLTTSIPHSITTVAGTIRHPNENGAEVFANVSLVVSSNPSLPRSSAGASAKRSLSVGAVLLSAAWKQGFDCLDQSSFAAFSQKQHLLSLCFCPDTKPRKAVGPTSGSPRQSAKHAQFALASATVRTVMPEPAEARRFKETIAKAMIARETLPISPICQPNKRGEPFSSARAFTLFARDEGCAYLSALQASHDTNGTFRTDGGGPLEDQANVASGKWQEFAKRWNADPSLVHHVLGRPEFHNCGPGDSPVYSVTQFPVYVAPEKAYRSIRDSMRTVTILKWLATTWDTFHSIFSTLQASQFSDKSFLRESKFNSKTFLESLSQQEDTTVITKGLSQVDMAARIVFDTFSDLLVQPSSWYNMVFFQNKWPPVADVPMALRKPLVALLRSKDKCLENLKGDAAAWCDIAKLGKLVRESKGTQGFFRSVTHVSSVSEKPDSSSGVMTQSGLSSSSLHSNPLEQAPSFTSLADVLQNVIGNQMSLRSLLVVGGMEEQKLSKIFGSASEQTVAEMAAKQLSLPTPLLLDISHWGRDKGSLQSLATAVLFDLMESYDVSVDTVFKDIHTVVSSPDFLILFDRFGALSFIPYLVSNPTILLGRAVMHFGHERKFEWATSTHLDASSSRISSIVKDLQEQDIRLSDLVQIMMRMLIGDCGGQPSEFSIPLPGHLNLWQRQEEFLETLQWNLCNAGLRQVRILANSIDHEAFIKDPFLRYEDMCNKLDVVTPSYFTIFSEDRTFYEPTVAEMLGFGHRNFPGRPVLYLGGDVMVDSTPLLRHVEPDSVWGRFSLLSSHSLSDPKSSRCSSTSFDGGADSWLVMSPLPTGLFDLLPFYQHNPQSQLTTAHHFQGFGYTVNNPCNLIKTFHNHFSIMHNSETVGSINQDTIDDGICCPSQDWDGGCTGCTGSFSDKAKSLMKQKNQKMKQSPRQIPALLDGIGIPSDWSWNTLDDLK